MRPMTKMTMVPLLLMLVSSLGSVRAAAPDEAQQPPPKPSVPTRVDLILTRLQGDKKISSVPYSVLVMANDPYSNSSGRVRIGFDVPTGTQSSTTTQQGVTTARADYRNIGIQIDFTVQTFDETRFRVGVNLTDSSIYSGEPESRTLPRTVDPVAFRTFSSQGVVLLRDGQSSQVIVATDKITGETLRADVTLIVIK